MRLFITLLLFSVTVVSAVAQRAAIKVTAAPVWQVVTSKQDTPYYITVENKGRDTQGEVAVLPNFGANDSVVYPLEMPAGSQKRVMIPVRYSYGIKFGYQHQSGLSESENVPNPVDAQQIAGLISNNPLDMQFPPRTGTDSNQRAIVGGGCQPQDAPDRLNGYYFLDSLVLGEGSERLRKEQIEAIRSYVRMGGVVVFLGGAATSAATDPRWGSIVPVSPSSLRNTTVQGQVVTERVGAVKPGAVKVDGIQVGSAYLTSYGLGLAVYYTINPFEASTKRLPSQQNDVLKCLNRTHKNAVFQNMYGMVGVEFENQNYSSMPTGSPMESAPTPVPPGASSGFDDSSDPFQLKLPQTGSLGWLLLGYIVVVLPVNFLILRKLKRLEWAWITTPIISLLFSGIILSSTLALYKASAICLTHGMVFLSGVPDDRSTLVGKSQMFFPKAQENDLGLRSIERIQPGYEYRGGQSSNMTFTDAGNQIIAPNVTTSNLAFREFGYVGHEDGFDGIEIGYRPIDARRSKLKITNRTRKRLMKVHIYTSDQLYIPKELTTLEPGRSYEMECSITKPKADLQNAYMGIANRMSSKMFVTGWLEDTRVGPTYGKSHPNSSTRFLTTPVYGRGF
jgi:hypothetical protein